MINNESTEAEDAVGNGHDDILTRLNLLLRILSKCREKQLIMTVSESDVDTVNEAATELASLREEASDSLRVLDAIAEYVGCPHDEELTVDHVRRHFEDMAQRQGIIGEGRLITNAESFDANAQEPSQ